MEYIDVKFKPLAEDDLVMLCQWFNRPHLQRWWREGDISLDAIREKYLPRIKGEDTAIPLIAYAEQLAIGYIQYYDVHAGDKAWWPDEPGPGVLGIDLFVAEASRLNKGLGTTMLRQFIQWLIKHEQPVEIRIDPRPNNIAAIRCYEKAGFKKRGIIQTPDGEAMMMQLFPGK